MFEALTKCYTPLGESPLCLTASERRRSVGDSTGDLTPSANFCSRILVGVEQSEGRLAGVEDVELGVLDDSLGGGEKAPE